MAQSGSTGRGGQKGRTPTPLSSSTPTNRSVHHARTIPTDRVPAHRRNRCDRDLDFVERRPGDHGRDLALLDLQVDHQTGAEVCPAPRQAVLVIAVPLEVAAP